MTQEFRFVASYRRLTVYKVIDWSKSWHGKRLAFWASAPDYETPDGRPLWNYSPEEFERDVLDVVGYLHWDACGCDQAPPLGLAANMNVMFRQRHNEAAQKYPDVSRSPCFQLKGVAQYSSEKHGWIKTDLTESDQGNGTD